VLVRVAGVEEVVAKLEEGSIEVDEYNTQNQ
jgi:hypothetical protein